MQRQQQAMLTIAADSMKVTAANQEAWVEICTCPISMVRPLKASVTIL